MGGQNYFKGGGDGKRAFGGVADLTLWPQSEMDNCKFKYKINFQF